MFLILGVGGGVVFLLLVVGMVISLAGRRSIVDERLDPYFQNENQVDTPEDGQSAVGEWVNTVVVRSSWGGRMAKELARADLKLKPSEFVSLMIIVGVGLSATSWYFGGRSILIAAIGFAIGMFIPQVYLKKQQGGRLVRFNEQLPDMLNLMVNGLRAGYSTVQAMEAVSRELPAPICDEFRRVVQEMQLGLPMERALDNLMRRIPSDDLDLTITAINVQREVGGNLAEILDTISHTIRERVRIKGEIRVLTSQVVYSGRFLSMMPVFIVGALWFMNRPYMMMFLDPETRMFGIPMLGFGALMVVAGYFVMGKISDINV
jgi:tight adherence protein B